MENTYRTPRTTVRRIAERGVYDRALIHAILDEATICHVGFVAAGWPTIIPMAYVRVGESIYVHGSKGSRLLQVAGSGAEICVAVTLLDGLVLARSAFHHSMNYRSAIVFGTGTVVESSAAKLDILRALSERLLPGRWSEVRQPSAIELKQTAVVGIGIREASAKIRSGPPRDDPEDYTLPIWAGVLPLYQAAGVPVPDPKQDPALPMPAYLTKAPARYSCRT
jgi:nitroimidazol reductase NimA-like FMN-containing flavoprotein (pyridoxamine 5'-phosphate oxidase superfamily)